MNKIFRYVMVMASAAVMAMNAYAEELSPIIQRNIPAGCPIESTVINDYGLRTQSKGDATASLTVSIILDSSREQEALNVLAISADPEKCLMYQLEKQGNVYVADIEPGVYDVVALINSDNDNTQIFLFSEDADVTSNKRILLNQRSANLSTNISRKSPSGLDLSLPETGDSGNCSIVDHLLLIKHAYFGTLLQNESAAFRNVCTHLQTNLIPQRFEFVRMDAYSWENGPVFMVIPINWENELNGPSDGGWKTINATFATTPMSSAWAAMQESPAFAMTGYFVVSGKRCNSYISIGNYNHEFPTDRIYYWTPEDYDGYYEYYPVMRSNLIAMADASVTSMPYHLTSEGLIPSGLNLIGSGSMMSDNGYLPENGHPRFSNPLADDAKLANAVPAMVCLPSSTDSESWDHGFMYDYTGRHGEQLGIDAYNFSDVITAAELSQIGGYRRTLKVTRDGEVICSTPGDFVKWLEWGNGSKYGMEVSMSNVLIDGELEGNNTATLLYSATNGYIPTVTSLQLRDNDNVTDRFEKGDNASLELTAGTFAFAGSRRFTYSAPSAVKAEYAPHGSSDFTELALTEIPEYFYLPGYGNYYKASLAGVNRASNDKWYDLRITVEGEDGAMQKQTLSPAFRLETTGGGSGIDSINSDKNVHKCNVYSIDGCVLARGIDNIESLKLDSGIYIVIDNGITRKIIID